MNISEIRQPQMKKIPDSSQKLQAFIHRITSFQEVIATSDFSQFVFPFGIGRELYTWIVDRSIGLRISHNFGGMRCPSSSRATQTDGSSICSATFISIFTSIESLTG